MHMDMALDRTMQILLACGLSLSFLVIKLYTFHKKRVDLPVVGGSGILGSWIASLRFDWRARACIQEGYEKHKDWAFQLATPSRWEIFICNESMIKEYRNLDSRLMSVSAIHAEFFQARYTLPGATDDIGIPMQVLSKSMTWQRVRMAAKDDNYFQLFYKELVHGLSEELPVTDTDWTVVPCFRMGSRLVARLVAMVIGGHPFCRDQEVIQLFSTYRDVVPKSAKFIRMFPEFLKPLAASVCAAPKVSMRLRTILIELVRQRRVNKQKTPKDLVDWMIKWVEDNSTPGYTDSDIAAQLVITVFGSIHSTSQVLAQCLFELSTREEYLEPLRQEVKECLKEYGGITKEALEAMKKLDSFTRECHRLNPLDSGSTGRCASEDFTFSNGVYIPAGSHIFAPNAPVLLDPEVYPNPEKFDAFRHYRYSQESGLENDRSFISTGKRNPQFGDGRHVCPGRFLAADAIRLTLVHCLMNYDVAIKGHGPRPANITTSKLLDPDFKSEIMVRKIRT